MDAPDVGEKIKDRYRLDTVLGQGGMGIVYQAHDEVLKRDVAIKVLSNIGLGTEGRAHLLREAQAVARLNHQNIVSVFDAGEENKMAFVVMELLKGESLFEQKPETLREIIRVARQVCQALDHAHSQGVVHRDLKPENIIRLANGVVKLTDFGLAQSVASRMSIARGNIVGTVFYISPEAALGQAVDGRADLYALGVMLYEWLTGRLPYTGDDPLAVISQHLYSPIIPPRTLCSDIPLALDDIVVLLLAKRPQDRPVSAAAVDQLLSLLVLSDQSPQSVLEPANSLGQIIRGRMVGRERELADVLAVWKRVTSGDGQVLLVSGEPGIGKTRLVRELLAHAAVVGGKVFYGECYAEGGKPYSPFAQILVDELNKPTQPGLELPEAILADLITISPELHTVYPDILQNHVGDPLTEQQRLIESMVSWMVDLAGRSPLVLFVDDAHWADSGSLLAIRQLARRARRLRLMIVLTYREVELVENSPLQALLYDLTRERLATRLKLTRLDRDQTKEMLEEMLTPSARVDEKLVDAIYQETEGNPFFIEEVCRALVEEGKLCCDDAFWQVTDLNDIGIPQSIRLTIQSRLSHLPETAQSILKLAAVIGREFDFETLQQASDLDEDALINVIEVAERAQIINEMPRSKTGATTFIFAHALIPSSLRESIIGLRRQRLHRKAALAIETLHPDDFESLAYHFEQAGEGERAIAYYSRATERALSIFANQEAEKYSRSALELTEASAERAPLLAFLGEALFRQGQYLRAAEAWNEAISLYQAGKNDDQTARLFARVARAIWYAGDAAGGLAICQKGLAAVPGSLETPGMAALLHETARAYRFMDQPENALPLCQQALALAKKLGLAEIQAETLATIGILPNQSYEDAYQALSRSIEIAESSHLPISAARAHLNLGGHLQTIGDLSTAYQHIKRAGDLAHQMRIYTWEQDYLLSAIDLAITMADFQTAEENIRAVRQLQGQLPNPASAIVAAQLMEAQIAWKRGDLSKAIEMLRSNRSDAIKSGDKDLPFYVYGGLAEALIEAGDLEGAEESLSELQTLEPHKAKDNLMFLAAMCLIRIKQSRLDEAKKVLEEVQALLGKKHHGIELAKSSWLEAELNNAERNWQEAWSKFAQAVELSKKVGYLWLEGFVLWKWAEDFEKSQTGDASSVRHLYDEARKAFERAKAPGYVAKVDQALKAIGA